MYIIGTKGLQKITYYSQRWSFNFEAEAWMDGCEITCAVNLDGVRGNPALVSEVQAILHVYCKCMLSAKKFRDNNM